MWGTVLSPTKSAVAQTNTRELVIQLTWQRSTEASGSVPFGFSLRSKVADGLSLPLDPSQPVFDNGIYTPPANVAAIPSGNEWASWPQWYGGCNSTFGVRHLRATFTLPVGLGDVLDFILFSPFYTDRGNIIPINDNMYHLNNSGKALGSASASHFEQVRVNYRCHVGRP